jgi:nucleotide-binding universal stress UspA family protein
MILICYDGSPDAKAAIDRGGELLHGQRAAVLTIWQPFIEVLAHTPTGFGLAPGMVDTAEIDKITRANAEERAQEGAQLARAAGFDAQPRTCSQQTTTAEAILADADAIDASAILIGSRGLTGVKSMLLGSVSHGVIHHADRAVIVVPSPEVSASRPSARAAHAA